MGKGGVAKNKPYFQKHHGHSLSKRCSDKSREWNVSKKNWNLWYLRILEYGARAHAPVELMDEKSVEPTNPEAIELSNSGLPVGGAEEREEEGGARHAEGTARRDAPEPKLSAAT